MPCLLELILFVPSAVEPLQEYDILHTLKTQFIRLCTAPRSTVSQQNRVIHTLRCEFKLFISLPVSSSVCSSKSATV